MNSLLSFGKSILLVEVRNQPVLKSGSMAVNPNQGGRPSARVEVIERPYEPRDRDRVRDICWNTAYEDEVKGHFYLDRTAFADLLTSYYTDYEPGSLWVAEHKGRVAGYVTGCLQTNRFRWFMATRILPGAFLRACLRGVFSRR